ncbi:hypothetical protein [Actinomadura xylanilytica]|uniref:hypothetical protein n=1 Tax=Actinomadura xylanilytica TaxID=887459 RepID=UPI00255AFF88|nr:hypothetical protein [Actinomadura xylanilytica]MDL4776349.1 hypothetical protein [Actinomadura xylanilytica]
MSFKTKSAAVMGIVAAGVTVLPATAFATTTAQPVEVKASCRGGAEANWLIPDGEGSWAGKVQWHDTNNDTGDDQDDFLITDRDLDGQSSSLWVKNNYTGKTYYKHVYSGEGYCMGIGSLPNGKTASWKACGWDDGKALECKTGKVTE